MATAAHTPTFEIRDYECEPGSHVLVAAGEIDLHAAPSLKDALRSVVEQAPRRLVLDLSGATFVDSAAIAVLAGHIKSTGSALTVACSNENVLRILEVSGLSRKLVFHDSVDEALGRDEPPPAGKLELRVAPQPDQLVHVRAFAAAAAHRFGLDSSECHGFVVAANEAVANAIRHGRPLYDGTIHVWAEEDDEGTLRLGVEDGGYFSLKPLADDPLRESGRGLEMMSHLVDAVALSQLDGTTRVELSVRRGAAPRA